MTLSVSYELKDATAGVRFVGPQNCPGSEPHMYTHEAPSGSGSVLCGAAGARAWFPCVDSPHSRCPFDVEVTVPRKSGDTAVCSGEFLGRRFGRVRWVGEVGREI